MVVKIGIIGYRNHASRLIKLINEIPECSIEFVFHPTKVLDDKHFTNNLSDMFDCDAIFIASPNQTHYEYLQNLFANYSGYIFCEKPPVTSYADLNNLAIIRDNIKDRLFFNFNYRFGKINECLSEQKYSKKIGKINHINIIASQGLAFKNEYLDSWRADGEKNLHNILDTVSIHYLDLLNLHFGKIIDVKYYPKLISGNGTSYDTCYIVLQYENNITASVLNSYAAPYINQISLLGTNGFLNIYENEQKILSPRDTFDSDGFFITPPVSEKKNFVFVDEYNNSLRNSICYFFNHVKDGKIIPLHQFQVSISTNKLILDLRAVTTQV